MRYDFSNLSALDFEELVHDLLQNLWGIRLELFKPGRDGGIDLRAGSDGKDLIVQCKNFAKSTYSNLKTKMREEELPKLRRLKPGRYVLVTSLPLSVSQKDDLLALLSPYVLNGNDIIGGNELERMLETEEQIVKRHHKLWLTSIPVLKTILHAAEHHQTSSYLERIRRKLPLYVQTSAFSRASDILADTGVAIISGPPGIGKSTLADMLLYNHMASGFSPVVIRGGLSEGRRLAIGNEKIIFHFDDFLGQTNLGDRPEFLGRREDSDLVDFIDWVVSSRRHRFVLTTREHVLSDALQRSEKLRQLELTKKRCLVTVADYGRDQRARILYNHLWFSELPTEYLQELLRDDFFFEIVDHRDFNPRIVEWLASYQRVHSVTSNQYQSHVKRLLENPHEIWRHAYRYELSQAARDLLSTMHSLAYVVFLDDLERAFGKLHAASLKRTNRQDVPAAWRTAMKDLEGSFITVRDGVVEFLNPSLRDFMATILDEDPDVSLDIVASATRFHQLERLWRGSKSDGPFPSVRERLLRDRENLVAGFHRLLQEPNLRWFQLPAGRSGHYVDAGFAERAEILLLMRFDIPEIAPVARKAVELVARKLKSWKLNIDDVAGFLQRVVIGEVKIDIEDVVPIFNEIDARLLEARAEEWVYLHKLREALGEHASLRLPSFGESFEHFCQSGLSDEALNYYEPSDFQLLQHALEQLQDLSDFDFSYEISAIDERLSEVEYDDYTSSSFIKSGAGSLEKNSVSAIDDDEIREMFSTLNYG
ncbi:restriction endonuclease [Ruegeria sp. SCP11]|uniref:nSTAND3 domain-containing NTPase n=1 Tax=Ruegeria sp. SCP11 TaxID=3141378 RepID=UPI003339B42F